MGLAFDRDLQRASGRRRAAPGRSRRSATARTGEAASSMVSSVLDLQRRAGNQATAALLDELTRPSVQRQGDDDGPSIDTLIGGARALATGVGLAPVELGA